MNIGQGRDLKLENKIQVEKEVCLTWYCIPNILPCSEQQKATSALRWLFAKMILMFHAAQQDVEDELKLDGCDSGNRVSAAVV
jgi:hypothetical protein